ncbi:putative transcriptional regulatory protein [Porphyridium purpureum]|uniref:Putative transcriptional regulatory protein n=1 Tax=Porphyridium purpureum TaxID=35688 RepID=A0A5J4YPQ7_PORPP|nr:putative transcriptional regulatory protein [Porphyridium purpureum]|eukprot:POR2564..scf295_9
MGLRSPDAGQYARRSQSCDAQRCAYAREWTRGQGAVAVRCRRVAARVYMGRRSEKIATRKGKQEKLRTKLFARVGKQIIAAIREGGDNVESNAALASALDAARAANFPKDNVERLMKKATSTDQEDYKVSLFEVYGHEGVGLLIQVFTDNNNRAISEMRTILNRQQVSMASAGSVSYNFDKKGMLLLRGVPSEGEQADELLMNAIEAGAEECEFSEEHDAFELFTEATDLMAVKQALQQEHGYAIERAELVMVPRTRCEVSEEAAEKNFTLMDALEDLDDVDQIFHNME